MPNESDDVGKFLLVVSAFYPAFQTGLDAANLVGRMGSVECHHAGK